jgi:hypothetical protein
MNDARQAFLDAAGTVRSVLAAGEVADRWDKPSVLRQMSVGALAGHLLRAATTVVAYLEQPPKGETPISPGEYYATILATSEISDPMHVAIRERAEKEGAQGHDAVVSRWDETVAHLIDVLGSEPDDRVLTVAGDLVMRLDDYLVTRLVEVVVHTDDLAASVGLNTPRFASAAMKLVFDHLIEVARVRHGDLAVLRGFSRRERDDVDPLRIF